MCKHPRLRMESCVTTILYVNSHLGGEQIRSDIIRQFELLKNYLHVVSEEHVNEADIGRIEDATNQLLQEIANNTELRRIDYRPTGWIN